MKAGKIFINYRREDSRADAGRLYDRLQARYPERVFRDVGSLEPGIEWREAIDKVLGDADACIVVIGKNWLTMPDAAGKRRLDDPKDTVRQELQTALKSGMRVFPILVGGAKMPAEEELPAELQALARRNALEVSEQDWNEDFEKLVKALERTLGWSPSAPAKGRIPTSSSPSAARWRRSDHRRGRRWFMRAGTEEGLSRAAEAIAHGPGQGSKGLTTSPDTYR